MHRPKWAATRLPALLAGALCLLVRAAAAQHPRAPVGVQIGYSRANFHGPSQGRLGSREGALAGAYLTGHLIGGLALQPELLFALKGGQAVATLQGGGTASMDVELAYVEMPVLAKWSPLPKRGHLHPVLFGGAAPSVRIGCDLELAVGETPLRAACEDIQGLMFQRMDFGVVMGGGVQRDWAETALALEVRYTVGLPSVLRDAVVHNRQLGVMLALNF